MSALHSQHLVDPELAALIPKLSMASLSDETLAAFKKGEREAGLASMGPPPESMVRSEMRISGPEGAPAVRVLCYRRDGHSKPRPAVLHIHGGGYVSGVPEKKDAVNAALAARLDCVVVSVDYRLAPETPFPGPLDDCYAALRWMFGEGGRALGIDPSRVAVRGESAGGGLAAAVSLLARDRGEFSVRFQLLSMPMLDDRAAVVPNPSPYLGELAWTPANNRYGWRCYLGREPGAADVSQYAAPARAERFERLPATFIGVGALDLLVEENLAFARDLARAGVPVELHVYPGAFHSFTGSKTASVALAFEAAAFAALERALRG